MEISSHSQFNSKAYLPSQQRDKVGPNNILPSGKIQKDQKNNPNIDTKILRTTKNIKDSSASEEQNRIAAETDPFQSIKLAKARHTASHRNELSYKVTAHDPQLPRQAEKALASYTSVENSQYGQELVNRIEVMV